MDEPGDLLQVVVDVEITTDGEKPPMIDVLCAGVFPDGTPIPPLPLTFPRRVRNVVRVPVGVPVDRSVYRVAAAPAADGSPAGDPPCVVHVDVVGAAAG